MNATPLLADLGFVFALTLPVFGSLFGATAAAMAALGAWKKCYQENRAAPFMLVAFVGAPLSQIIYGMILMNAIKGAAGTTEPATLLVMGLLGGLAIGASAWLQGKVGALAADAMGETGKGFGIFIMVVGIIETVALLGLVFFMQAIR